MAFLNRGLSLSLTDERAVAPVADEDIADIDGDGVPDTEALRRVSYKYDGGIADFVTYLNAKKGPAHQT